MHSNYILGPYCLQYRLSNTSADNKAGDICCESAAIIQMHSNYILGPYCLQYRLSNTSADNKAGDICCESLEND